MGPGACASAQAAAGLGGEVEKQENEVWPGAHVYGSSSCELQSNKFEPV